MGGGVGVPPLVYLAEAFAREGRPFTFLQGARTKDDLVCLEELAALGVQPEVTTEDGSAGEKGLVTAPLERALGTGAPVVYACGPEGMLKAVAPLCRGRVPSHLSLEARMGCGYGVCLGCVVPVNRTAGGRYERVCQEGPVFDGEVVRGSRAGRLHRLRPPQEPRHPGVGMLRLRPGHGTATWTSTASAASSSRASPWRAARATRRRASGRPGAA